MSDTNIIEKVTTQLVELKDTSELMLDLAYSALLLNNTFLAEEVQQLNRNVIDVNISLETLLLNCSLPQEESGLISLFRLGITAERIGRAASEIAQVVLRGIEPHPILSMMIQSTDKTVDYATITQGSSIVGKTLKAVEIPEHTGWWILVIKRGDKWIRPKASTIFEVGDQVIASGYSDGESEFKRLVTESPA